MTLLEKGSTEKRKQEKPRYPACGACKRYNGFKAYCTKLHFATYIRDSACDMFEWNEE